MKNPGKREPTGIFKGKTYFSSIWKYLIFLNSGAKIQEVFK